MNVTHFSSKRENICRFFGIGRLEMTEEPMYCLEGPFLAVFQGLEPVLLMQRYGSFHGRQWNHPGDETTDEAVYLY